MANIFEEPCEAYYKIFTDKATKGYKYNYISPLELQRTLIATATKSVGINKMINASEENPSFFSTLPRYAFAELLHICTKLGDKLSDDSNIGYIPCKKGISKHFNTMLNKLTGKEGKFLRKACTKLRQTSGLDSDTFVHNLVTSTIGCLYPNPSRVQDFVEPILTEFLDKSIYRYKTPLKGKIKIMPTEGISAAVVYVFNSLKHNGLVIPDDTIGVITPSCFPYLEIPSLQNYKLKQICIKADETNNWEISQEEIGKICDSKMKVLLLINPSNPSGLSLSASSVRMIAASVRKKNPNLIILEDNTYSPFVKEFNSFFNVLPRNTIGLFSFSNYFGTTGWRLGTIAMHNSNIIDSIFLKKAPEDVNSRYGILTKNPDKLKFIDRILADSRQVAEAHTAGLSTPQQTLMALFAVCNLLDKSHHYEDTIEEILWEHVNDLLQPIEYEVNDSDLSTNYYVVIDIAKAADRLMGGTSFGDYLRNQRDPIEFLIKLAKKYGTVLSPSIGFAGPYWGVRVSLANFKSEKYEKIGVNLRLLIDEYYDDFKRWENKQRRQK
jgi:aspartate 4-decarboxylase